MGVPPTSAFAGCYHKPPSQPSSYQQLSRPEGCGGFVFSSLPPGSPDKEANLYPLLLPLVAWKSSPSNWGLGLLHGNSTDPSPCPAGGSWEGPVPHSGEPHPPRTPHSGPRRPRWWPGRGVLGGKPGLTAGGSPRGSLFAGLARWLVYNLGTTEQEAWSQPEAQRASLARDPAPPISTAASLPCLGAGSPSAQGPGLAYVCVQHQGKPGLGSSSEGCGLRAEVRAPFCQLVRSLRLTTHTWPSSSQPLTLHPKQPRVPIHQQKNG